MQRKAQVERNTLETRIRVAIDLDGTGASRFDTGIPFLEHMLDQVARHGLLDLSVRAEGDLHIDAHHTVEDIGIGFLFAPLYHSAMRFAATARKEVGLRSIFNMLGPLTNPAGANCQIIGVYAPELTEMFAHTLRLLGSRQAYVVHGHDGLDEISVCAPTRVSELNDDMIRTYDIYPEQYFGQ